MFRRVQQNRVFLVILGFVGGGVVVVGGVLTSLYLFVMISNDLY